MNEIRRFQVWKRTQGGTVGYIVIGSPAEQLAEILMRKGYREVADFEATHREALKVGELFGNGPVTE